MSNNQQIDLTAAKEQYEKTLRDANKANATVVAYINDIEQLNDFLRERQKTDPAAVTADDIEDFKILLKTQRYADKSISRKVNSIKSFFRYLADREIIAQNPAKSVPQPKYEQLPPKILTREQYQALREACRNDIRMTAIVELLLQTGMRISELASLRLSDLDFDNNIVNIETTDTGVNRKVPLNEVAKNALATYLKVRPRAREEIVFLTKTCRPFLIRNIRNSIDRYFKLAGLQTGKTKVKVNDLRHTFIVEQLRAGVPLIYISQLVGHKRVTTTEKYLVFIEQDKNPADIKIETL